MLKDLKWSNAGRISWSFSENYINVYVENVTDVYYDEYNKIVHAKIDEKFTLQSEILFNRSGDIILEYDLAGNLLKWQYGYLTFKNLKQVIYVANLSAILVLSNNSIDIIDFFSSKAKKVEADFGYKIDYIDIELLKNNSTTNSTEKIIVICDGNNSLDIYNRNRKKFYLDIYTKKLVENGLYY